MTIKQQGGIFGRNPTFNDVTTNSLTVNGDETITGSLTVDGDALFVNGVNNRVGINTLSPSTTFDVSGNVYASGIIRNTGGGSASSPSFQPGVDGDTGMFHPASNTIGFTTAGSEKLRILTSGGITFNGDTATANALDDYEEGTWTPTLNAYAGTPTVSGYYVKIGQMVYVECSVTLDGTSDASNYIIDGLPFTMASPYLGGGAVNTNDGGVADALVGSDVAGRLRLRNSSGSNQTYNSIGVSSTVTLNAQYRSA